MKVRLGEHLVFLSIGAGKPVMWDDADGAVGETEPVVLSELVMLLICTRAGCLNTVEGF